LEELCERKKELYNHVCKYNILSTHFYVDHISFCAFCAYLKAYNIQVRQEILLWFFRVLWIYMAKVSLLSFSLAHTLWWRLFMEWRYCNGNKMYCYKMWIIIFILTLLINRNRVRARVLAVECVWKVFHYILLSCYDVDCKFYEWAHENFLLLFYDRNDKVKETFFPVPPFSALKIIIIIHDLWELGRRKIQFIFRGLVRNFLSFLL
jgi:hypothetical protein